MKKFLTLFLLFWWALIFPEFSFNSFTTELTDENINYSDFYTSETQTEYLTEIEYTTWFKTIFLSSHK